MQINWLLASLIFTLVSGHGFPISLKIGGKPFKICKAGNGDSGSVGWEFADYGPRDPGSVAMTCNVVTGGEPGQTPKAYATVNAGDKVEIDWSIYWSYDHLGPKDFYLGRCTNDCMGEDVTEVSWFKIGEVAYEGGKWHDRENIETVTLPSNIKEGFWILRHSRLTIQTTGHPQIYPHCYRLRILGEGSELPEGVKIPGPALDPEDPGYMVNIYNGNLENYRNPGPAVYRSGQQGSGQQDSGKKGSGKKGSGKKGSGKKGSGKKGSGKKGSGKKGSDDKSTYSNTGSYSNGSNDRFDRFDKNNGSNPNKVTTPIVTT